MPTRRQLSRNRSQLRNRANDCNCRRATGSTDRLAGAVQHGDPVRAGSRSSRLVGRDSFSDYPPEAREVPDVGGGFMALNMELIVSAKPDLVLASPLTPPEQLADLSKIGLTVHVVPNPTSFEELYANLEAVAELTGHEIRRRGAGGGAAGTRGGGQRAGGPGRRQAAGLLRAGCDRSERTVHLGPGHLRRSADRSPQAARTSARNSRASGCR